MEVSSEITVDKLTTICLKSVSVETRTFISTCYVEATHCTLLLTYGEETNTYNMLVLYLTHYKQN